MGAPKGRRKRRQNGERALYASVAGSVIERLDDGAKMMNMARAAYIELLVETMPVDARGLPPWLAELFDAEHLPGMAREEQEPAAA